MEEIYDPSSKWFESDDFNGQKSKYEIFDMEQMSDQMKFFNTNEQLVAVQKFGGIIATTQNTKDIIINTNSQNPNVDSFCFFQNDGESISIIKRQYQYSIVGFDFNEEECLVVIYENGWYSLIGPPNYCVQEQFKLNKNFESNLILDAKIKNQYLVFLATDGQFYYVQNLGVNKKLTKFGDPVQNIDSKFQFQVIIPEDIEESNQLYLQNGSDFLILFSNQDGITLMDQTHKKQIFDQIPNMQIEKFQVSQSSKYLSIIFKQSQKYQITILSLEDSQELQITHQLQSKNPYTNIAWCGDYSIVISNKKQAFLIDQNKYQEISFDQQGISLFQEVDGVKMISKASNQLLRKLVPAYIGMYQLFSESAGVKLLNQYQESDQIFYEDIRFEHKILSTAIEECIQCGKFMLDNQKQTIFLKAASYGIKFLQGDELKIFQENQDQSQNIGIISQRLRALNQIKKNIHKRTITYDQLYFILNQKNPAYLIQILLRHNFHFLAQKVCEQLEFNKSIASLVYEDWACKKIKQKNISNESIIQLIKEKFSQIEVVNFSKLAIQAREIGKIALVEQLLGNQQRIFLNTICYIYLSKQYINYSQINSQILSIKNENQSSRRYFRLQNIIQIRLQWQNSTADYKMYLNTIHNTFEQFIQDLEPNLEKKFKTYLELAYVEVQEDSIQYYRKALQASIEKRDINMIYIVIIRMLEKNIDEKNIENMMNKTQISQNCLINFYKIFDKNKLLRFFKQNHMYQRNADFFMQEAYLTDCLQDRHDNLMFAQNNLEILKDQLQLEIINNQTIILQEVINTQSRNVYELPFNSIISSLMDSIQKDKDDYIMKFQKKTNISNRSTQLIRIKNIIENNRFYDLDAAINQLTKKDFQSILIPLIQLIIMNCDENYHRAEKYICMLVDIDKQLDFFKITKNFQKAVDIAIKHEKSDFLRNLQGFQLDNNLQKIIQQFLQN